MEQKQAVNMLETLALQALSDTAVRGADHSSRFAFVGAGTWQAEVIGHAADVVHAQTPQELRALMGKSTHPVIFLPQTAFMTPEVLERICVESAFDKLIIQEKRQS